MKCIHLIKHVNPKMCKLWTLSFANELRNLAKVVRDRVKGTNTIFFIKHEEIPVNGMATYG